MAVRPWLAANKRPAPAPGDLLAVGRNDVEAWLMAQRTGGLSQATLRNRWVALRNLYGWALAEEEIEATRSSESSSPKRTARRPAS